jgi:hypothetical protein
MNLEERKMRKVICFFLLITLIGVPVVSAQDGGGRPPPGPMGGGGDRFGPPRRLLTHIETVEVVVLESSPVQLQLMVMGEHRDGCDMPVTVRQIRFRNRVWVRIFRVQPDGMMCPTILRPYEATISLNGVFEPGTYQINVNGVEVEYEF